MNRLAAVILLAAASLAAQTPQARMEERAREIQSLSATLEQRITVLGLDQTMTGRVRFLAPELFRMDLTMSVGGTSVRMLTLSNGRTLSVYSELLGTVQTFDLRRVRAVRKDWTGEAMDPARPFQDCAPGTVRALGEETVDGVPCVRFEARPLPDPPGSPLLADLDLVRLWLAKDDGFPRRVVFLDKTGREALTQTFRSVKVNALVDPAVFLFHPPEGVQTVDSTDLVLQGLRGQGKE